MGKALLRTAQAALLIALVQGAAGKAHALAVECAGCVAAINKTTDAVNTGNATLEDIKSLLTQLVNHVNQIRLAVGPLTTTASTGTLAQQADFRNLTGLVPDFKGYDLHQGIKIDMGDLDGLRQDVNGIFQIYTDVTKLKDKVQKGRYWEAVPDIAKLTNRRRTVFSESVRDAIATSLYAQNAVPTAKATELTLDQDRRGAGTLQAKANANAKIGMEILGRLNHLITQQAALLRLMGARQLQELPREIDGLENVDTPPPQRGTASQLFGRDQ